MTSILFFCAHGRPCPNFIGFAAVSAALGAAFLVLPRSRRVWGEVFWLCPGLGGFWGWFFCFAAVSAALGAVFLVLPQSRRLWRSFFGIAAVSAALAEFFWYCRGLGGFGGAFLVLPQLHWLTASIGSREKNIAAKIQPHLQKFCVQDDLCRGVAVLNKLRLPYMKKQAVQPPVRFFSQTAPATVCRPPDSLAPQKRQQNVQPRLFAFSCRAAKAAAD